MELTERRRYKRMYLSVKDGIVAVFTFPGMDVEVISGSLLDISEGGLCISFTKNANVAVIVGGQLILKQIKGTTKLRGLANVKAMIRWIIDIEDAKNLTFGCEFLDLTESDKQIIRNFIETWPVSSK